MYQTTKVEFMNWKKNYQQKNSDKMVIKEVGGVVWKVINKNERRSYIKNNNISRGRGGN